MGDVVILLQSMYAMMAKCEELSKTMKPIYHLADQVYPCHKGMILK